MANQQHLDILKQGAEVWNEWREKNHDIIPDLSEADLQGVNLGSTDLSRADLRRADLRDANFLYLGNLREADLSGANLSGAELEGADLRGANLTNVNFFQAHIFEASFSGANLSQSFFGQAIVVRTELSKAIITRANLELANLSGSNLSEADLSGARLSNAILTEANLSGANLMGAVLNNTVLVRTNLERTNLASCSIHGISVWNVQLKDAIQTNLIITDHHEPTITVDNLEVAQFIYLLLNNERIRHVIDTITSKVVLILGRFTPERKTVLNAIRDALRKQDYLPVLFDFEKPASRDLTETVSTLAHLARFIIVDLTDPSSAPHEVATVIPQTIVPVQPLLTLQPLIVEGKAVERREYAMFEDLRSRYHWVLPTFRYQDTADLLASLQEKVIAPAEHKAQELAKR